MKIKFNIFVFIIILLSQNFYIVRINAQQGDVNQVL
jgi:hypothetical protein